jgi:hypothetical protein
MPVGRVDHVPAPSWVRGSFEDEWDTGLHGAPCGLMGIGRANAAIPIPERARGRCKVENRSDRWPDRPTIYAGHSVGWRGSMFSLGDRPEGLHADGRNRRSPAPAWSPRPHFGPAHPTVHRSSLHGAATCSLLGGVKIQFVQEPAAVVCMRREWSSEGYRPGGLGLLNPATVHHRSSFRPRTQLDPRRTPGSKR